MDNDYDRLALNMKPAESSMVDNGTKSASTKLPLPPSTSQSPQQDVHDMLPPSPSLEERAVKRSTSNSDAATRVLKKGDLVRVLERRERGIKNREGGLGRVFRARRIKPSPLSDNEEASTPSHPFRYDVIWVLGGRIFNLERTDLIYTTANAEGLTDVSSTRARRIRKPTAAMLDSEEEKSSNSKKQKTTKGERTETSEDVGDGTRKQPKKANERGSDDDASKQSAKNGTKITAVSKIKSQTTSSCSGGLGKNRRRRVEKDSTAADKSDESEADTEEHSRTSNALDLYERHRREFEKCLNRLEKVDHFGWFVGLPPQGYDEFYCDEEDVDEKEMRTGDGNTFRSDHKEGDGVDLPATETNAVPSNANSGNETESTEQEVDPKINGANSDITSRNNGSVPDLHKTRQKGVDGSQDVTKSQPFASFGTYAGYSQKVSFPSHPPFNWTVVRKRMNHGRYVLDRIKMEEERMNSLLGPYREWKNKQMKSDDISTEIKASLDSENLIDGKSSDRKDGAYALKSAPCGALHPVGVHWEFFREDVIGMCDAAIARIPKGTSFQSGTLGYAANKIKDAMEQTYLRTGRRHMSEMLVSDARHKFSLALKSAENKEAAMQGQWRKNAFPERRYERLTSSNVVCDGLSKLDQRSAIYELETNLPDSFVGLSYTYDDVSQSEGWMKSVVGASDQNEDSDENRTALALASDDGVVRAQVRATMAALLIAVQDRVMTDMEILRQPELRSANWENGTFNRYNLDCNPDSGAKCGEESLQMWQDTSTREPFPSKGLDCDPRMNGSYSNQVRIPRESYPPPEVAEQPVWGIDCYTRRNVALCLETDFDHGVAIEFIEKWLLPAINACPVDIAHNIASAARILEGLPFTGDQTSDEKDELDSDKSVTIEDGNSVALGSHTLLCNALLDKIRTSGPPWLKAAAHQLRTAAEALGSDAFRVHPKGHGAVVLRQDGLPANSLVTYYRGEVYPPWRWGEKMDAIDRTQQRLGLRPNLPDFYNMVLERPRVDPRGYGLLYVDASRKSGMGSSFSHSCEPTCEVRVAAVNGQLSLAMTTVRDVERGEELTFDYHAVTESLNEYHAAICLCGYHQCRGSFLHFATADVYQQVLSRNAPIAVRFSSLVRGCMKKVMSKEDEHVLKNHGFGTAAFGAVSFNHYRGKYPFKSRDNPDEPLDSMENVPIWLRTFVADTLRYIEYERRALPVALLQNHISKESKKSTPEGKSTAMSNKSKLNLSKNIGKVKGSEVNSTERRKKKVSKDHEHDKKNVRLKTNESAGGAERTLIDREDIAEQCFDTQPPSGKELGETVEGIEEDRPGVIKQLREMCETVNQTHDYSNEQGRHQSKVLMGTEQTRREKMNGLMGGKLMVHFSNSTSQNQEPSHGDKLISMSNKKVIANNSGLAAYKIDGHQSDPCTDRKMKTETTTGLGERTKKDVISAERRQDIKLVRESNVKRARIKESEEESLPNKDRLRNDAGKYLVCSHTHQMDEAKENEMRGLDNGKLGSSERNHAEENGQGASFDRFDGVGKLTEAVNYRKNPDKEAVPYLTCAQENEKVTVGVETSKLEGVSKRGSFIDNENGERGTVESPNGGRDKVGSNSKSSSKKRRSPKTQSVDDKPIPRSKPEPVFLYFSRTQKERFVSVLEDQGVTGLRGIDLKRAVQKVAACTWKALGEDMKQYWKDRAFAEWEMSGGKERAKLEEERRLRAAEKMAEKKQQDAAKKSAAKKAAAALKKDVAAKEKAEKQASAAAKKGDAAKVTAARKEAAAAHVAAKKDAVARKIAKMRKHDKKESQAQDVRKFKVKRDKKRKRDEISKASNENRKSKGKTRVGSRKNFTKGMVPQKSASDSDGKGTSCAGASKISFEAADSEGWSAMEQRIQQLTQTLSRVGRVLDRHRESTFVASKSLSRSSASSAYLRSRIHSPLSIMPDEHVVHWIWNHNDGVVQTLLRNITKEPCTSPSLREELRAVFEKYCQLKSFDLAEDKSHSGKTAAIGQVTLLSPVEARTSLTTALLEFRRCILVALNSMEEDVHRHDREKSRLKAKARRDKMRKLRELAKKAESAATKDEATYVDSQTKHGEFHGSEKNEVPEICLSSTSIATEECLSNDGTSKVAQKNGCVPEHQQLVLSDVVDGRLKPRVFHGDYCPSARENDLESGESSNADMISPESKVPIPDSSFKSKLNEERASLEQSTSWNAETASFHSVSSSQGLSIQTGSTSRIDLVNSFSERMSNDLDREGKRGFSVDGDLCQQSAELENHQLGEECFVRPQITLSGVSPDPSIKDTPLLKNVEMRIPSPESPVTVKKESAVSVPCSPVKQENETGPIKRIEMNEDSSAEKIGSTSWLTARPWLEHWKQRHKLEAAADVLLLYAHTSTFFILKPYCSFESTPIEVYARELGNAVPRSVVELAIEDSNETSDISLVNSENTKTAGICGSEAVAADHQVSTKLEMNRCSGRDSDVGEQSSTASFGNFHPQIERKGGSLGDESACAEAMVFSHDSSTKRKTFSSQNRKGSDVELCEHDDVITEVVIRYQGEYVLSQLLQWYNGGIGQKPGLPNMLGCVTLPSLSGCFAEKDGVKEVRLESPSGVKSRSTRVTAYAAEIRQCIIDWFEDRYKRGNPWPDEVCSFFTVDAEQATSMSFDWSPMGSPILDLLVTGDETNIQLILNALKNETKHNRDSVAEEGLDLSVKEKTAADRLQSTVDEGMPAQAVANWVQCENPNCLKWRKLPWHVDVDLLPETFFCKDNIWNPNSNSCSAPEDEWDEGDAPISFNDTGSQNINQEKRDQGLNLRVDEPDFSLGARFDVLRKSRNGEEKHVEAVVVDVDSNEKTVKFHFPKMNVKFDEWIEVGSHRIASHRSYTGTTSGKSAKKKGRLASKRAVKAAGKSE